MSDADSLFVNYNNEASNSFLLTIRHPPSTEGSLLPGLQVYPWEGGIFGCFSHLAGTQKRVTVAAWLALI